MRSYVRTLSGSSRPANNRDRNARSRNVPRKSPILILVTERSTSALFLAFPRMARIAECLKVVIIEWIAVVAYRPDVVNHLTEYVLTTRLMRSAQWLFASMTLARTLPCG
jgi:hypothetical protein